MGERKAKTDYESFREARILENQARLASLGVQKTRSELLSITTPTKSEKTRVKKSRNLDLTSTPLRRSSRLQGSGAAVNEALFEDSDSENEGKKRGRNGTLTKGKNGLAILQLSPEALARRCTSKGRGSLYDPTYGICCHFCRQKKLCGEEDCKRCSDLDLDQPCIGKTDCSNCHSSCGILCRACLKIRYGEELEEVRENKEWICPHCTEAKGTRPYWICNSSFCLKKRKMAPTGIAIFTAREMGYKSVAHLLMDKLKRKDKTRCEAVTA